MSAIYCNDGALCKSSGCTMSNRRCEYRGREEGMSDVIEEGDCVRVDINAAQTTICFRAEVLHKPCATGDSWHFKNLDTGAIVYISEGCTITKNHGSEAGRKE